MLLTLLFAVLFTIGASADSFADTPLFDDFEEYRLKAKVLNIVSEEQADAVYFTSIEYVELQIIEKGEFCNITVSVENAKTGNPGIDLNVKVGDIVYVLLQVEDDVIINSYMEDHDRLPMIYWLVAVFVGLVLILGRAKGLRSLITLLISIALVLYVLIPQVSLGRNPVVVSIIVSVLAIATTFIFVSGFNKKSLVAILGTAGGIIAGGILAGIFSNIGDLTGMSMQESQMLIYAQEGVTYDFRGLLLAGVIIGALGAIMDIGMSISSSLYELSERAAGITRRELWDAGLNIGQDIMGTMVNTLILAYAGASLPLLMIYHVYEAPIKSVLNTDLMATEILRSLAGSIGLIICIPLTVIAAILVYKEHPPRDEGETEQLD